jgi:hypothetical protein
MVTAAEVEQFRTDGFVVLRHLFDAEPLSAEVDRALSESDLGAEPSGHADIRFRYVPMMVEQTPMSLALLDTCAVLAAELLDASVLPVRAKAVRYVASAESHRDSTSVLRSLGCVAYLEPLTAGTGALRVVPGSHLLIGAVGDGADVVLETDPGDLIVLDEHLVHGSVGGRDRRQWRVDFFADPTSSAEESAAEAYLLATFPPDWDGGYDVDRFPSYGDHWRSRARPWHGRLDQLGAYTAAAAQEDFTRGRHGHL